MTRRIFLAICAVACGLSSTTDVLGAGSTYIALGDSLTFGETDLQYVSSNGDRGYVGLVANSLAAQNGGVRPNVINLAIDGETSTSFTTGVGRVAPVVGRTDAILASENTNYNPNALVSQSTLFQAAVATQAALGNTVSTVSITLGDNDLFALANMPGFTAGSATDPMLASALATYQANYSAILANIRKLLPNATILLVNDYNPFPAQPNNPFGPLAAVGGPMVNTIIQNLAAQYGARYVDDASLFVGHEAAYTYLAALPSGTVIAGTDGGTAPLGDVHPNATGYSVIAGAVITAAAVPEPSSLVLMGLGLASAAAVAGRRARSVRSPASIVGIAPRGQARTGSSEIPPGCGMRLVMTSWHHDHNGFVGNAWPVIVQ